MVDKEDKDQNETDQESTPAKVPQRTVREVVVTHLDAPPPSGKRTIHPRRPAPLVPTREEQTEERPPKDTEAEKQDSE
jgi:hypothetical protein